MLVRGPDGAERGRCVEEVEHGHARHLAGLVARTRYGVGQKVETSMMQATLVYQTSLVAQYFANGQQPPSLGSATANLVPHQGFRASDGYPFYYRRYAPAGAPRARVVFVHGIRSHGGWYTRSCCALAAAGFEVYFLDRRGAGLNTAHRGDAPGFRRLLDDVVEIPVYGLPYSYNVVTAATMAMYEYCRQYPKG